MVKLTRTSETEPYDSVLFCGICGMEVHVTRWEQKRVVDEWTEDQLLAWSESADHDARNHLVAEHPFRLWLWKKLHWRWLLGGLAQ